jgi:sugar phosphate isomerase/epimerase
VLSLAHLSLIATPPRQLIEIAGRSGFDLVDLRLSPATPTDRVYGDSERIALCRQLLPVLGDNGLGVWDVEIIRIGEETQAGDHLPLMEAAAVLGARRLKIVCDSADHGLAAETLARLCQLAAPFGLTLDLEYMVFSGIRTLDDALAMVARAAQPNLQVLVDALHWVRAGGTVQALRAAPPGRLGYVQLCDGPLRGPQGRDALIQEARTSRLAPGDGEFPLDDLLDAMPPGCVASLEVPLPLGCEAQAHARHLFEAARALLDRHPQGAVA